MGRTRRSDRWKGIRPNASCATAAGRRSAVLGRSRDVGQFTPGAGQTLIFIAILKVAAGLGLLLVGGEVLLRGAVALARRFGLSNLVIGLTVVAAATSMPELVVTVTAGLEGVPDIGVGNVIGSNIANILLILGAAALLFPIRTKPRALARDLIALGGATGFMVLVSVTGSFDRLHGAIMLVLLFAYIFYTYHDERRAPADATDGPADEAADLKAPTKGGVALLLVAVGVAGLVCGSELLIDGAVTIARQAGVSEAIIGLTLVAIGTSLPELATAVVAGIRRHSEVALGNVLGSNIFNILGVLAALAITVPFGVPEELRHVDIWFMGIATLILIPVLISGHRIGRLEGGFFLLLYIGYIGWQFRRMPPML